MEKSLKIFITNTVLNIIVIVLHSIVVFSIYKKRLVDNRYFLIKALSSFDVAYSLLTIAASVPLLFYAENRAWDLVINLLNVMLFTMYALSLQTSVLISVDRYIAVGWSLSYHTVLPKDKLKKCLAGMFLIDLLVHFVLVFSTEVKDVGLYRTSSPLMLWFLTLRLLTCIVIVVTGLRACKLRRQNIEHLESRAVSFGQQAEQLQVLQVLKGSLKDVSVLNFWTVIFLVGLIGVGMVEIFFDVNKFGVVIVLTIIAESFVGPIVSMTTQREIRKFISTFCRRHTTKAVDFGHERNLISLLTVTFLIVPPRTARNYTTIVDVLFKRSFKKSLEGDQRD